MNARNSEWLVACGSALLVAASNRGYADAPAAPRVAQAEEARIQVVAKAAPAVVCIYDSGRHGGGSGVLIDPAGYGLTNFHVVAGMLDTRRGLGGLSDGRLYELQVLGIDPTGDVAMFRLSRESTDVTALPVDESGNPQSNTSDAFASQPSAAPSNVSSPFPFAELGDSDAVKVGDFALAMGNPFVLSEDQTPTVTMGIITGVHRYQWGSGGNTLLYSDCLQTDAPINPGNSGGPLFDVQGRVLGINGRISVGERGRLNVGFGYAISINQIKRFIPTLRAGLMAQHGLLQATVNDELVFNDLLENAPAWSIGIRTGDHLINFGGQKVRSANHFASLLGTFPANWPVPVSFQHDGQTVHRIARLEPLKPKLPKPFEPDPEINHREAVHVIEQFRSALLGTSDRAPGGRWVLNSTRQVVPADPSVAPDRREALYPADGPATQTIFDSDGHVLRRVEYTDTTAEWISGSERYDTPIEEALIYRGMYALLGTILGTGPIDAERLTHAGGDELVQLGDNGEVLESTLLESLALKLGAHATAAYQFAADDHLLRRITVRDLPTGFEANLVFSAYRDDGGLRFPGTIDIESSKGRYRETITQARREVK